MTPQLQSQLSSILSMLQDSIKQGASLASEQLPDIAQQVVTYHLYSSVVFMVVPMLFCILFFFMCGWAVYADEETLAQGFSALSVLSFIAFVILIVFNLPILLQCLLAPKVFLLEYVANLIQ